MPTGIAVKILSGNGQHVYVFEVQVSNYRPHQYKHIYYARLDGQTRPAPHYLVEALMRRVSYPNIEAYLKITNKEEVEGTSSTSSFTLDIDIMICNFSEFQNEEDILLHVTVGPGVFYRWQQNRNPAKLYSQDGHNLRIENLVKTLHFGLHAVHSERIIVRKEELSGDEELSNQHEMMIVILFGGKHSPVKFSEYIINVSKSVVNYDYNDLIVSRKENIAMADHQRNLGTTQRDILKHRLGR